MSTARGKKPRILVIGAHPDDCEVTTGGTAALWAAAGFTVRFVSATDGSAGHQRMSGPSLVRRRAAEARAAAAVIGIEAQVMDAPDGRLEPTLQRREKFIALIREFRPDLVLTHRPNDYHPDHRYTATLVQDSAYMVTVPKIVPRVPVLRENPPIAWMADRFQKPAPFQPDIVVGIDAVLEKKLEMLHCHASQYYEWVPWNLGILAQVPKGECERRAWLHDFRLKAGADCARRYRGKLLQLYGRRLGSRIKYAEAFEACEYGAPLSAERIRRLFPFMGA